MITLKESILGNTRNKILDAKDKIGKLGSLFDIYSFGLYTSGISFVEAGHIDINKLDSLTKGMDYINIDDTQSYKQLRRILDNPDKEYDRDNKPYFEVLLKVLMWIENLPCLEFESMRDFEQRLPMFLSDAFKQITKKKIVVFMGNFYNDIILNIEWKKGRGTNSLFNIKIDKQKAKDYFASMNESILSSTKSNVNGVKKLMSSLGITHPIDELRLYPYATSTLVSHLDLDKLNKETRGKEFISKHAKDSVENYIRRYWEWFDENPDEADKLTKFFIWLDNIDLEGVDTSKEIETILNRELKSILKNDKISINNRGNGSNLWWFSIILGKKMEGVVFGIKVNP
jgi:hypothetical protein